MQTCKESRLNSESAGDSKSYFSEVKCRCMRMNRISWCRDPATRWAAFWAAVGLGDSPKGTSRERGIGTGKGQVNALWPQQNAPGAHDALQSLLLQVIEHSRSQ